LPLLNKYIFTIKGTYLGGLLREKNVEVIIIRTPLSTQENGSSLNNVDYHMMRYHIALTF